MEEIDIGVLSQKVGLSTATIRFYESKGLIKAIGRKGLRRQYSISVIQTISLIKILKNGGLSLSEIGKIFIDGNRIKIDRELVGKKLDLVDEQIRNLNNLLILFKHIKFCPSEDHLLCPNFIKMLN